MLVKTGVEDKACWKLREMSCGTVGWMQSRQFNLRREREIYSGLC